MNANILIVFLLVTWVLMMTWVGVTMANKVYETTGAPMSIISSHSETHYPLTGIAMPIPARDKNAERTPLVISHPESNNGKLALCGLILSMAGLMLYLRRM